MLIEGISSSFTVKANYDLDPKENFFVSFYSTTNNQKIFNNWKWLGYAYNVF